MQKYQTDTGQKGKGPAVNIEIIPGRKRRTCSIASNKMEIRLDRAKISIINERIQQNNPEKEELTVANETGVSNADPPSEVQD